MKTKTKSAANEYLIKFFYGVTPKKREGGKPFSIDEWEKKREKKEHRRMREVQWQKWTSNESFSHSQVHITHDGEKTLCNKNIPQLRKADRWNHLSDHPDRRLQEKQYPRKGETNLHRCTQGHHLRMNGAIESATGGTTYDIYMEYSPTNKALHHYEHAEHGTCQCCVKRSKGKFINNHRTNSREEKEATK